AFLEATLRLARSAQLIVKLSNEEVQRSPYNDKFFWDDDEGEEEEGEEEEGW
ncbi:hypothetical protein VYU27_008675, partial [Nannochloropsis oceanica]